MSLKYFFLMPAPLYNPPNALKMKDLRVPLHLQNPPIIFDLYDFPHLKMQFPILCMLSVRTSFGLSFFQDNNMYNVNYIFGLLLK